MDLNALRMFISVVQTGSLSAAAEKLDIPLPTLSRRIRELEQQLNIQLLERSVRGTRVTMAGSRLYEQSNQNIEGLLNAEYVLKNEQTLLKGRLRISLPPAFEPWWSLLAEFRKTYPDIKTSVYMVERRVDLIEDGIDVALRVGAIVHETMVARKITEYRHCLVAHPSLLKKIGIPKTVSDLHRFPCAVWSNGANSSATWKLGTHVFTPEAVLSTNDYLHLRNGALNGEFVTELPPFLARQAIQNGELIPLLTDNLFPEQQLNLLYPSHRHPSLIVRAYLDFCVEYFKKHKLSD
ncbi:LysR family transcriptional regulator [Acinetobacter pittii]|uniref:LysR family transcriptional regulator n=1 Tax=Acinetobacter pittii TaxID=48296 RepID=UPI003B431B04